MENFTQNFYGDETRWFMGVVEDSFDDPEF